MMRKYFSLIAAVMAVVSGVLVLQLKTAVQNKKDDVKAVAQQIHDDKAATRILEAEWAYLTTPRVLQERSIQFLALMSPRARQILAEPSVIPFRLKGVDAGEDPGVLLPTVHRGEAGKNKDTKNTSKKERDL